MYMHIAEYYRPSHQYLSGDSAHVLVYYRREYFRYLLAACDFQQWHASILLRLDTMFVLKVMVR
jgi:hypothetical protein